MAGDEGERKTKGSLPIDAVPEEEEATAAAPTGTGTEESEADRAGADADADSVDDDVALELESGRANVSAGPSCPDGVGALEMETGDADTSYPNLRADPSAAAESDDDVLASALVSEVGHPREVDEEHGLKLHNVQAPLSASRGKKEQRIVLNGQVDRSPSERDRGASAEGWEVTNLEDFDFDAAARGDDTEDVGSLSRAIPESEQKALEAWLNSTPAPSPPPSPRRQKLKDILLGESYAPSRSSGFYNDETRYNERSFSDQTRMPRSSQSNESGVTIHDAKRRKKSSNTGSNIPSGTPYDNIKFSSSDTPPKDCKKSGPNGKGNCSTMRTSCCARGRRRWVVAVTILAALVVGQISWRNSEASRLELQKNLRTIPANSERSLRNSGLGGTEFNSSNPVDVGNEPTPKNPQEGTIEQHENRKKENVTQKSEPLNPDEFMKDLKPPNGFKSQEKGTHSGNELESKERQSSTEVAEADPNAMKKNTIQSQHETGMSKHEVNIHPGEAIRESKKGKGPIDAPASADNLRMAQKVEQESIFEDITNVANGGRFLKEKTNDSYRLKDSLVRVLEESEMQKLQEALEVEKAAHKKTKMQLELQRMRQELERERLEHEGTKQKIKEISSEERKTLQSLDSGSNSTLGGQANSLSKDAAAVTDSAKGFNLSMPGPNISMADPNTSMGGPNTSMAGPNISIPDLDQSGKDIHGVDVGVFKVNNVSNDSTTAFESNKDAVYVNSSSLDSDQIPENLDDASNKPHSNNRTIDSSANGRSDGVLKSQIFSKGLSEEKRNYLPQNASLSERNSKVDVSSVKVDSNVASEAPTNTPTNPSENNRTSVDDVSSSLGKPDHINVMSPSAEGQVSSGPLGNKTSGQGSHNDPVQKKRRVKDESMDDSTMENATTKKNTSEHGNHSDLIKKEKENMNKTENSSKATHEGRSNSTTPASNKFKEKAAVSSLGKSQMQESPTENATKEGPELEPEMHLKAEAKS